MSGSISSAGKTASFAHPALNALLSRIHLLQELQEDSVPISKGKNPGLRALGGHQRPEQPFKSALSFPLKAAQGDRATQQGLLSAPQVEELNSTPNLSA